MTKPVITAGGNITIGDYTGGNRTTVVQDNSTGAVIEERDGKWFVDGTEVPADDPRVIKAKALAADLSKIGDQIANEVEAKLRAKGVL